MRTWEIRGRYYGEHGKRCVVRVPAQDYAAAVRIARAEKIDWESIGAVVIDAEADRIAAVEAAKSIFPADDRNVC